MVYFSIEVERKKAHFIIVNPESYGYKSLIINQNQSSC